MTVSHVSVAFAFIAAMTAAVVAMKAARADRLALDEMYKQLEPVTHSE